MALESSITGASPGTMLTAAQSNGACIGDNNLVLIIILVIVVWYLFFREK